MNEKEKELFDFLDERKAQVLSEVKELASQDRTDESNILKAKSNINLDRRSQIFCSF